MEGVREVGRDGTSLGIEGADGRTTLSVANLAAREDLVAKIGTPEGRGSRCLACDGDALGAWETMASFARDIEQQDYPYIAYALPGSPTPTINSSSAIASLIYYSGLDASPRLPCGLHMSPGTTTLLGTGGGDMLRIDNRFSSLLGGRGTDEFFGGADRNRIDKFYGGEGDDLFHWSPGFNIVHGGQPGLAYAHDGSDVMDYSGAGAITITSNRYWIPHKVPTLPDSFACARELLAHERVARRCAAGSVGKRGLRGACGTRGRQAPVLPQQLPDRRRQRRARESCDSTHLPRLRPQLAHGFLRRHRCEGFARQSEWAKTLQGLQGRRVEVRGWIEYRSGPYIAIEDPSQLAVIEDGARPQLSPPAGPVLSSERPSEPRKRKRPARNVPGVDL